jgi:hypothetical protein
MTSHYPQLTPGQCLSIATRLQREQHWCCYGPQRQAQILAYVKCLVERNPNGYLARHWKEVYR